MLNECAFRDHRHLRNNGLPFYIYIIFIQYKNVSGTCKPILSICLPDQFELICSIMDIRKRILTFRPINVVQIRLQHLNIVVEAVYNIFRNSVYGTYSNMWTNFTNFWYKIMFSIVHGIK